MATDIGDRTRHFPAIEKKHGEKIATWLARLAELGDAKYPEQIAWLRENHGFSQAHANALVMYSRGSASSRRYATPGAYFASLPPRAARTSRAIFAAVSASFPALELVIAWNQPMMRTGGGYVLGVSASKNHLTVNPFSADVLASCAPKLKGCTVNKKTFTVPLDWSVDASLLRLLVKARLAELK